MRKLWFNLLILSALLLAACGQKSTPAAVPAATNPAGKPTTAPKAAATSSGPAMKCNVVSSSPTQGPTEASMFPPISKDDWVLGNSKNPTMTVIEYSDFQ